MFSFQVVPILMHLIKGISSVRLYIPKDLRSQDSRQSVGKSLQVDLTAGFTGVRAWAQAAHALKQLHQHKDRDQTILPTQANSSQVTINQNLHRRMAKRYCQVELHENHSIVWLRPRSHRTITKRLGESWPNGGKLCSSRTKIWTRSKSLFLILLRGEDFPINLWFSLNRKWGSGFLMAYPCWIRSKIWTLRKRASWRLLRWAGNSA